VQCLDAEVCGAGEVAHGEPCCHQAIVDPPVTGGSTAGRALDPPGTGAPRVESSGTYDKTNLPDELILTSYFIVRDGKIVTLIVIPNTPA